MGDNKASEPRKGDLVRWVCDYALFAADEYGNAWPHDPQYEYGVIMEVSHADPNAIIIFGTGSKIRYTAHMIDDGIEVVSATRKRVVIHSKDEIKKFEKYSSIPANLRAKIFLFGR